MLQEVYVSYDIWKLAAANLPIYYISKPGNTYTILATSEDLYVRAEVSGSEATDFEDNYKTSATSVGSVEESLIRAMSLLKVPFTEVRDLDGTPKLIEELRSDSRYTVVTHNFADKCTWYQESTRVTDEVLTTTDPSRKVWSAVHDFWIDLAHGRVSDENDFSASYLPVIKVDGSTKTEATPFGDGTDGDFVIDYETGVVTFHNDVGAGAVVTASYSYAESSVFTIVPTSGKLIRLYEAECQMSSDVVMNDDLWYGIYVTITPGPGEILAKQKRYKTIQDIINEANGAYPIVPAMGGVKRGTSHDTITFPWHYVSRTDLLSSKSMKIKIKLPSNNACGGHSAVVAFYCVSITE